MQILLLPLQIFTRYHCCAAQLLIAKNIIGTKIAKNSMFNLIKVAKIKMFSAAVDSQKSHKSFKN